MHCWHYYRLPKTPKQTKLSSQPINDQQYTEEKREKVQNPDSSQFCKRVSIPLFSLATNYCTPKKWACDPKQHNLYRINLTMWLRVTRNNESCTQSYQILQSQRAKQSAFSLRSTSRQKLSICNFTTCQKARSNIRRIPKLFSGFLHSTSPSKTSENDFLLPVETDVVSSWYIFCNPLSAHFFLTFYKHDNSSEPIKKRLRRSENIVC